MQYDEAVCRFASAYSRLIKTTPKTTKRPKPIVHLRMRDRPQWYNVSSRGANTLPAAVLDELLSTLMNLAPVLEVLVLKTREGYLSQKDRKQGKSLLLPPKATTGFFATVSAPHLQALQYKIVSPPRRHHGITQLQQYIIRHVSLFSYQNTRPPPPLPAS